MNTFLVNVRETGKAELKSSRYLRYTIHHNE